MEKTEQEVLLKIVASNREVKKLYDKHRKLEREIENFSRYINYSGSAGLKLQALKKEKLRNKEALLSMISDVRADA